MVIIQPRVNNLDSELIERYRRISPATVGHLLHFGFLDPAIKPLGRRIKLVGPAVTLRLPPTDSVMVHKALDICQPGDVLVIDRNGDNKHASWGEMTALCAKVKGLAGTVVDGAITDKPEIEEMGFTTYYRSVSAVTCRSQSIGGEINVPIQVGGVPVHPGDLILGDDNGIVVIPADQAAALLPLAEPREAREAYVREELLKGRPLSDISGAAAKVEEMLRRQQTK